MSGTKSKNTIEVGFELVTDTTRKEIIKYSVIVSKFNGKWLFVRHHEKSSYEIPGGKVEHGETPADAAKRELFEETGATACELTELCIYTVSRTTPEETTISYGMLYFAEIKNLGAKPESEISEVGIFDTIPENDNLTYPLIQPYLFSYVTDYLFIRELIEDAKSINVFDNKTFNKILINKINNGWSSDIKYKITSLDSSFLLKVSPENDFNRKKTEFEFITNLYDKGLPVNKPYDFFLCEKQKLVCSLFSWIEGESAEETISLFSEDEQYRLGYDAGKALCEIHKSESLVPKINWFDFYSEKAHNRINAFLKCDFSVEGSDVAIEYVLKNLKLLEHRPLVMQHGDFHIGNMIISDKKINIIDFNRYDIGDPIEEFNRIFFSAQVSPQFATGQINGYFDNKIPDNFFELLTLYSVVNAIAAIPWGATFGIEDYDNMVKFAIFVLKSFHFSQGSKQNLIPSWFVD